MSEQQKQPEPERFTLSWDKPLPVYAMVGILNGLTLMYPKAKWIVGVNSTPGMTFELGAPADLPENFWDDLQDEAKRIAGEG